MIDNIIIKKKSLTDEEIQTVVKNLGLRKIVVGANCIYDNSNLQNLQTLNVKINESKGIKIFGSLHKLNNLYAINKSVNHNEFGILEVSNILKKMFNYLGLTMVGFEVTSYEIGINIQLNNDCKEYLKHFKSIGKLDKAKKFYVNPKYKDERCITTIFHRDLRKSYKAYDKGFEMADKRRKDIEPFNILRIETTYRRCENLNLDNFIDKDYLIQLQRVFFEDWKNVNFEKIEKLPSQLSYTKYKLIQDILKYGVNEVKEKYKKLKDIGLISNQEYNYISRYLSKQWHDDWMKIEYKTTIYENEILNKLFDHANKVLKFSHKINLN